MTRKFKQEGIGHAQPWTQIVSAQHHTALLPHQDILVWNKIYILILLKKVNRFISESNGCCHYPDILVSDFSI